MAKRTRIKGRRTAAQKPRAHALHRRLEDEPSSARAAHSPVAAERQAERSPAYTSRLSDPQIQGAQRQAIAAHLGRTGGNRYLQRVLSGVQDGRAPAATLAPATTVQREPEPAPAETPTPDTAAVPVHPDLDALVQRELEGFLNEFQSIPVTVKWVEYSGTECIPQEEQVAVHPPYFMNVRKPEKAKPRTLARYKTAIENRKAASRSASNLIAEFSRKKSKGGIGLSRIQVGKSHPEDIRKILQAALDRDLIKPGKGRDHPDAQDLREWLDHYGIGIDCSGFVSQALNRVMAEIHDRPLEAEEVLASGAREIKEEGSPIDDPAQLRPGDTMHIPGHIRIISSVDRDADGHVVFVTAESRSGGEADVGPDRAEWRYAGDDLQKRKSAESKWKESGEKPAYYRYHRLGAIDQAP